MYRIHTYTFIRKWIFLLANLISLWLLASLYLSSVLLSFVSDPATSPLCLAFPIEWHSEPYCKIVQTYVLFSPSLLHYHFHHHHHYPVQITHQTSSCVRCWRRHIIFHLDWGELCGDEDLVWMWISAEQREEERERERVGKKAVKIRWEHCVGI